MTPTRHFRVPRLPAVLPILLAGLALFAGPVGAVTVDNLYRAEVEVAGKDHDARSDGFRKALGQVLIKVSGSSAALANPDAEELLASPERFVQQFRYEAIGENGGSGNASHHLYVQFAQGRLERALRERGIVIWGEQRPELLVWLAVDSGAERGIVSSDDGSEAREHFMERARERGLPTMLPLMDMEDRARIEFVDIQGGFMGAVQAASGRYRPTAMLVGHVRPRGGEWAGSWSLVGVGDRKRWQSGANELGAAVAAGVDGATDRVARAFAGRGEEARELRLRVTAVQGLDAYARVSEYLASLVRVESAEVVQLQPREVVFRVIMNGRLADLERSITLGSTLSLVRSGGTTGARSRRDDLPSELDQAVSAPPDGEPAPADRQPVDLTFRLVG